MNIKTFLLLVLSVGLHAGKFEDAVDSCARSTLNSVQLFADTLKDKSLDAMTIKDYLVL